MDEFNWLHLSDWHQGAPDSDRTVVLEHLFKDIKSRDALHSSLAHIDAVILSGDVTNSGKKDEFEKVTSTLMRPLKELFGSHVKFIIAPGNHDLDHETLNEIPGPWIDPLIVFSTNRNKKMGDMLNDNKKIPVIRSQFGEFYRFCDDHGFPYGNSFVKAEIFEKIDYKIGVCAINSAICCARHNLRAAGRDDENPYWDYGALAVTERQIRAAIASVENCDLKILVLHHPLSWISVEEQPLLDQLISANFDLVLHGHEHLPRFMSIENNISDVKFIPAGTMFEKRIPENPRFTNAINYGTYSVVKREGRIYHRRWFEERDQWDTDDRYWIGGFTNFVLRPKNHSFRKNRSVVASIQKQYNTFFSKRPAKKVEITLRHQPVEISGQTYIQATVRYRLDLYPGEKEEFRFAWIKNKRIAESSQEEVSRKAYEFISITPFAPRFEDDEENQNLKFGIVDLGTEEVSIEYEFRMLEQTDGVWYFSLNRFVDVVKIIIVKSPSVRYEHQSLGGFPPLKLIEDNILGVETMESNIGHLPHQGVMVQWYI